MNVLFSEELRVMYLALADYFKGAQFDVEKMQYDAAIVLGLLVKVEDVYVYQMGLELPCKRPDILDRGTS